MLDLACAGALCIRARRVSATWPEPGVAAPSAGAHLRIAAVPSQLLASVMIMRAIGRYTGSGQAWAMLVIGSIFAALPARSGAEDSHAAAASQCSSGARAAGAVASVRDGRTLVLADGREVRLASIEVPPLEGVDGVPSVAPAARQSRQALAVLVEDADIGIKTAGRERDRYGRLFGQVFALKEGTERWIQAEMVTRGLARVAVQASEPSCLAELLRREGAARAEKLGLWADPYYASRLADDPATVSAERGRFTLVEGKVLSIGESGGTIYLNFGRRWTKDFTVTIAKRNEAKFSAAGLDPKKLAGKRVRVRGWIEERGGPWVDATRPEQIELVERN